jgi:hypothetical protein
VAGVLAGTFGFDVARGDRTGTGRLSSALPLERVAGDFAGATFYLCGADERFRPVLYASSEGQAGLIGGSLTEALELIVGIPFWHDCLGYSGGGDLEVMRRTARYSLRDLLDSDSTINADQERVAGVLSLNIPSIDVLLVRLHSAVSSSEPEYLFSDGTGEYGGLFGPFEPERNRLWR